MKNKIKSEIIIISKSKFFIWIIIGELILMTYNAFKVGMQMQVPVEGGYYTYILMSLTYLLGIILPIAIGGFLGGFDEQETMIEYKLCNQSRNHWLVSKFMAMFVMLFGFLLLLIGIGLVVDMMKGTIDGNLGSNILLIFQRFLVIFVIWLFWGIFSFGIGLLFESPVGSVIFSLALYFGEQYIGRYIKLTYGILWNQKSIEYYFFHNDTVPFGVVQSSYENVMKSSAYLVLIMVLACIVSFTYLKKKYPNK